ncbi:type II toxin-antitoxin system VapB family antitoxin [Haloactinopolyspora sp.]|uniref:antitoxin n=1 Tax=Haloactinopolyspora sp. TaxID=1966353 RepID=UPI0026175984|nr:type II toxin-antitoxin system VapB family antitoxin [Haloactinopolyspora sp.]
MSLDTAETGVARVFMHGRSQAVRLPRQFRFDTDRVRVRRVGYGVLLEPMITDVDDWLDALDRYSEVDFMPEGRDQPPMLTDDDKLFP